MALVSIYNDELPLIESQNLPRCFHSDEISQFISDVIDGIPINMNKLINIVNYYFIISHSFINLLGFLIVKRLLGKSNFIGSFHWKLDKATLFKTFN